MQAITWAAAWRGSRRACCPLPVHLSSVGRWRASWRAVAVMGVYCRGRRVAGPVGVLGGVGAVVGRRGGPWGGPAAWSGSWPGVVSSVLLLIVAALMVGPVRWPWCWLLAVQPGRVRLLGVLPWPWPVLCSACLGCWRCGLALSMAVIVSAGGPHAVGVLFLFGSLPQVHSRVAGVPAGVFPALTRRGLVPLPQKPIKRLTSKNPAKNKKCEITKIILTYNSKCYIIVTVRREK